MDIFQNEQARIEKRIPEVVPQLEDIGARGQIIAEKLHQLKNALKYPESSGRKYFGSEIKAEEVKLKFEVIKGELDGYSENAAILIKDLTTILTEVRSVSSDSLPNYRSKTVTLWAFGSAFSGRGLLTYLLTISAIILSSWLLGVTAVICDSILLYPHVLTIRSSYKCLHDEFLGDAPFAFLLLWFGNALNCGNLTDDRLIEDLLHIVRRRLFCILCVKLRLRILRNDFWRG
jgi:hypothetical protein